MNQTSNPILSVVVPTYNRAAYLPGIFYFFNRVLERGIMQAHELEVIISNNCSTDETEQVLKKAPVGLPLKVVSPDRHLTTAEENLFFGISKSTGRMIWLLGDDDSPNIKIFDNLVRRIRQDLDDIIICSSSGVSFTGQIFDARTICSNTSLISNLMDFARRTGLIFTLAGFSTTLLRGDIARSTLGNTKIYFDVSQIYAHVFWIIDSFHNKRFHYFSQNLVCYKENASDVIDTGHWKRYANKMGTFERFSWTLGLARLCMKLRDRINVPAGWFGEVIDQNWGQRYRLLDMMVHSFVSQIQSHNTRKLECRTMTADEAREFCDFLFKESPTYSQMIGPLGLFSRQDLNNIPRNVLQQVSDQVHPSMIGFFYRRYVISKINGWTIYFYHEHYYASSLESLHPKAIEQFRDICPIESDYLQIAQSWDEIVQKCVSREAKRMGLDDEANSLSTLSYADIAFIVRLRKLVLRFKAFVPSWLLRASR